MSSLDDIDLLYIPRDQFYTIERPLYDLFIYGRYNEAFKELYIQHCLKNYHATYILGMYYEFGLAPIHKCLGTASTMYSCVAAYCNDYLRSKAIDGLKRVIRLESNKYYI